MYIIRMQFLCEVANIAEHMRHLSQRSRGHGGRFYWIPQVCSMNFIDRQTLYVLLVVPRLITFILIMQPLVGMGLSSG